MYALITCVVLMIAHASSMFVDQKVLRIAKLLYYKMSRVARLPHCEVLQATRSLYCKVLKCELKSRSYNFDSKNNFKRSDNFA